MWYFTLFPHFTLYFMVKYRNLRLLAIYSTLDDITAQTFFLHEKYFLPVFIVS
jgi:hypothetical protein